MMLQSFYQFFYRYDIHSVICYALISAFMYALCKPKAKKLRMRIYVLIGALSFMLVYSIIVSALYPDAASVASGKKPYGYYYFCNVALALFWAGLLLRGSIMEKITYLLFFFVAIHLYNTATSPLFMQPNALQQTNFPALDLMVKCGLYVFLLVFVMLFKRFMISSSVPLDWFARIAILALPASLLIGDALFLFRNDIALGAPILAAIILLDLPVIYYLVYKIFRSYEDKQHLDESIAHLEAEQAVYRNAYAMRQQIREERHELKNNYFQLQTLLKNRQYEALSDRLEAIAGALNNTLAAYETGNTFLDYLLSKKAQTAEALNIPMQTEILLGADYTIDETACGTILTNLLDNAIEASEHEAAPSIKVAMWIHQGYFTCQISNKVSTDIFATNPTLKTTKSNASAHGYGLRIVRQKISDANGMLDTFVKDDQFSALFMLPLK